MKAKHKKTLQLIFKHPVSGNIKWKDVEALLLALGATIKQREGSRIHVELFNDDKIYHRPHPQPTTDKGAVANVREWLKSNGVKP
jgi:hypothetical protein